MTTLICPCGSRLNIRGMPPGKSGLCPTCGQPIRVPRAEPVGSTPIPVAATIGDSEWDWEGIYEVEEPPPPPPVEPAPNPDQPLINPDEPPPPPVATRSPATRGERPAPEATGPWFPPSLGFPARGMEGLMMVVSVGTAFWVMGTLVPEYCLGLTADGIKLGTPTMGHLVSLITATPVILLSPLVLTYWLQYLARVLVSGAVGEPDPPRPPDRDIDGLLGGLGSWFAWLVLGLGVGLVPVAVGFSLGMLASAQLIPLGLAGYPYVLMALLLSFLHDEDLAARPWRVIAALVRVAPSFLILTLTTAWLVGMAGGSFALVLKLREDHFWTYILANFPCWLALVWISIVTMHTLGTYYHAHRQQLRWRRPPAWWN